MKRYNRQKQRQWNINKRQRMSKEQSKMDNPNKLATLEAQDEEKQNKNNTICVGHHYAQTNKVT